MDRRQPTTGWRAASFAAALFAITLNFLQPLAHAALMRAGGPMAAATMWGAFCLPTAGENDAQAPAPAGGKIHECCLGLAQASALATPPAAFVFVEPVVAEIHFAPDVDVLSPVGIRDGPNQPRAPPSLV